MKKTSYMAAILAISSFSNVCFSATDFSGFRLGGGFSSTSLEVEDDSGYTTYDDDYGNGFKIESGYDFNQIVGVNVSYETNNETINNWDIKGESFKLAADIGYAFPVNQVFLKPYGKIGFVSYSEEESYGYYQIETDDSSVFVGIGLRFQSNHFYADLSLDTYTLDNYDGDDYDLTFVQTALTAGYKF